MHRLHVLFLGVYGLALPFIFHVTILVLDGITDRQTNKQTYEWTNEQTHINKFNIRKELLKYNFTIKLYHIDNMVPNKSSYCQISLPIPCEESRCYGGWGREDSPYVGWHAQEHPSLRYQGWYISLWLLEKRLKSAL